MELVDPAPIHNGKKKKPSSNYYLFYHEIQNKHPCLFSSASMLKSMSSPPTCLPDFTLAKSSPTRSPFSAISESNVVCGSSGGCWPWPLSVLDSHPLFLCTLCTGYSPLLLESVPQGIWVHDIITSLLKYHLLSILFSL